MSSELIVQNLDHLGIVAGLVDELGLVEQINQRVGQDPRERISAGVVVKAMILNGLGFVTAPLYLFEQFLWVRRQSICLERECCRSTLTMTA